jgi:uncharacterized protein DUF4038/collagenase-like protein with putative collagen-binding domain
MAGLSSLVLPRVADADRGMKTPRPGRLIFGGPQTPWVGPSVDFAKHGRLRVSSSGRFLEHVDGAFFPYVADTGWELMTNLTLSEATAYLEDRRTKGISIINNCLIGIFYTPNRNGDHPFVNGNLDSPNNAYFNFVDSIVAVARTKGIALLFVLVWANHYGDPSRLTIKDFTEAQAANFGTYIANRYVSEPNILFGVGGDYDTPIAPVVKRKYLAMGAAINAAAPNALITAHSGGTGNRGSCSACDFQGYTWYSFSGCQSGHFSKNNPDAYLLISLGWNATPTKPTVNLESSYENSPVNFTSTNGYFTPFDVRQQMWWSLCAGGMGATYGNNSVWAFQRPGQAFPMPAARPQHPNWYNALGPPLQPIAAQVRHIRSLLTARPAFRTPDQTLVTNDLSGGRKIICCRGADFAWIYTPHGDGFTANMGKISGSSAKAYWFDVRTGAVTYIDTYANRGTQAFDPPGSSAAGNDYVLLLDDAAVTFPIPGA